MKAFTLGKKLLCTLLQKLGVSKKTLVRFGLQSKAKKLWPRQYEIWFDPNSPKSTYLCIKHLRGGCSERVTVKNITCTENNHGLRNVFEQIPKGLHHQLIEGLLNTMHGDTAFLCAILCDEDVGAEILQMYQNDFFSTVSDWSKARTPTFVTPRGHQEDHPALVA